MTNESDVSLCRRALRSRVLLPAVLLAPLVLCGGCGKTQAPAPSAKHLTAARTRPSATRPGAQATAAPSARSDGTIVAACLLQVYDRFITIEDVLRTGRLNFSRLPDDLSEEAFRAEASPVVVETIRRSLGMMLMLCEAEHHLSEDFKNYIEMEMKNIRQEMVTAAGGTESLLRRDLEANGLVLADVLKDRRRMLTIQLYMTRKFRAGIDVDRRMLWEYYRTHTSEFEQNKKVRLRILAAPFGAFDSKQEEGSPPPKEAARALLREAAQALKAGEDIADVARRTAGKMRARNGDEWDSRKFPGKVYVRRMESEAGLWPTMSPDSFRDAELAKVAGRLKAGDVSDVIDADECCYLVKAEEVHAAQSIRFEDAQERIRGKLWDREYRRRTDTHFTTVLKQYEQFQGAEGASRMREFQRIVLDQVVARHWKK